MQCRSVNWLTTLVLNRGAIVLITRTMKDQRCLCAASWPNEQSYFLLNNQQLPELRNNSVAKLTTVDTIQEQWYS